MPTSPMRTIATSTEPRKMHHYKISEAAAASGLTPANIRFYEKEKLLKQSIRGDNSYRIYSDADVHQLRFNLETAVDR